MWQTDSSKGLTANWAGGSFADLRVDIQRDGSGVDVHFGDVMIGHLRPIAPEKLSAPSEQFVRGKQWHCVFPQGNAPEMQGQYSLKLVWTVMRETTDYVLLEPVVSIQTTLLDSHPTLDWIVPGEPLDPDSSRSTSDPTSQRSVAYSRSKSAGSGVVVATLLASGDAAATMDQSDSSALRLRLFGEFLEKGVIRKARPWVIIACDANAIPPTTIKNLCLELEQSPPPLTA